MRRVRKVFTEEWCGRALYESGTTATAQAETTALRAVEVISLGARLEGPSLVLKTKIGSEISVARKTIRVSDKSGAEIPDGKGATVRITFSDARTVCVSST
jgi:hypothetical protein